jgi:hypothetical protein
VIHYHGTPLSPRTALMQLAGKHFCVPVSDGRDAHTCLAIGQSVMWDNGAFSAFTKGGALDVPAFYAWVEPFLAQPHWAVVPDKIDGTVDEQRAMVATWPFPKALGAPVWHTGLSLDWLLEIAETWPRVCFGSSGRYWQIGSDDWCRRTDEAFNALAQRHAHLPWIHMLRGMSLSGDRWPFASVDSVNVARNYKDTNTDPERMARRLDAVQCPVRWQAEPIQEALFA